jgi:hypothetical protein
MRGRQLLTKCFCLRCRLEPLNAMEWRRRTKLKDLFSLNSIKSRRKHAKTALEPRTPTKPISTFFCYCRRFKAISALVSEKVLIDFSQKNKAGKTVRKSFRRDWIKRGKKGQRHTRLNDTLNKLGRVFGYQSIKLTIPERALAEGKRGKIVSVEIKLPPDADGKISRWFTTRPVETQGLTRFVDKTFYFIN